ncbi:roadblock/LC7 domain-containing protein [Actinomadura rupiterrae]|uniref:roadblock/LC7 domain-containing protein n=1 Tax=Actinomadura rupiterrae TaxID=559627 RepID=UPI0020A3226A|nr:roadblock/LC7 domain-containing protein [Actinomadura rupiterrae]MCP2334709.1 putative regulator of Ras-like GTPase activity (Roadblock/LC7/MglB family) [Actinomadura rupiterrae]
MSQAAMTADQVRVLLDGLVARAAGGGGGAVLLSSDGLVVASSAGLDREDAEHLAALVAGVQGLARGACRRFSGGEVLQSVIELDSMLVFMVPAGPHAVLAALCPAESDAGAVAYAMAELAEGLAERPPVIPRLSGFGVR